MGEEIEVDFKHFIKLAKTSVISWDSLTNLLNEMVSNFVLSKELNKVLLEELKLSVETLSNEKDTSSEENQRNQPTEFQNESDHDNDKNSSAEMVNLELNNVENDETDNEMSNVNYEAESENLNKIVEFEERSRSETDEDDSSKKVFECKICWRRFSSNTQFELHEKKS